MDRFITWDFPLPRTHTGIMFGNATTGVLAWGQDSSLKLTLGRADLWDHRGGMPPWSDKQNFKSIRKCLEANDAQGIKEIFACATEKTPGQPARPSVVPVGRFDIELGKGAKLLRAKLDLKKAVAKVVYSKGGKELELSIAVSMDSQVCLIELPKGEKAAIQSVPTWNYLGDYLKSISFVEPELFEEGELKGWLQKLPADPGVCACSLNASSKIWISVERSKDDAVKAVLEAKKAGASKFLKALQLWWDAYWKDVPEAEMPNKSLARLYAYGLYKFACFTNPSGVPASLQGPWIEEYAMPPWSSDYHFNINVQMCYWPAYKANRAKHLLPMFEMVWSWRDKLKANAKAFVGIDDGYMLPHAVDDHCVCMGSFWTGTIDHACAAWIAQMMFSYYRQTLDKKFLKEMAFPFMHGVMRVYEEMMERDGKRYSLPVSVSPEYRGAEMNAWGRDASFQLAAVHRLLNDLNEASSVLGVSLPKSWKAISEGLPEATLIGKPGEERLALWEGTDLEESHRHHSHMASICPFESIDPYSEKWRKTVSNTIRHWTKMGMGMWSGWCMPWASMIHSRLGNGGMAELILEIWERVFTNKGYGTLHDCDIFGFSLMGGGSFERPSDSRASIEKLNRREVMQMDAAMGALTAIQDMLMHSRKGVVHLMPGVPHSWKECSFKSMPAEGGFLLSAEISNYAFRKAEVESQLGGTLLLANPWGEAAVRIKTGGKTVEASGEVLSLKLAKGSSACIEPAAQLD